MVHAVSCGTHFTWSPSTSFPRISHVRWVLQQEAWQGADPPRIGTSGKYSLATRAAITPDVPVLGQALLLADATDLGGRDALVVAVVPLANVLGDLDTGVALGSVALYLAMLLPGELVGEAEVQELKCALGTLARRNVAGDGFSVLQGKGNTDEVDDFNKVCVG